jgi:hypothetical protein
MMFPANIWIKISARDRAGGRRLAQGISIGANSLDGKPPGLIVASYRARLPRRSAT